MNLFETVKGAVTTKDAAQRYGIHVNRSGMTCCVFHDDHTPSMKIDERFHCFGCGADGDVIDFTARLFGLSLREAAEKLVADFNIYCGYDIKKISPRGNDPITAKRSLVRRLHNYKNENYMVLCKYFRLLEDWKKQYAPKSEKEQWHPLFVEAVQNTARVSYLLDELQGCTVEEAKEIIAGCKNEIARYDSRVREFRPQQDRRTMDVFR